MEVLDSAGWQHRHALSICNVVLITAAAAVVIFIIIAITMGANPFSRHATN